MMFITMGITLLNTVIKVVSAIFYRSYPPFLRQSFGESKL